MKKGKEKETRAFSPSRRGGRGEKGAGKGKRLGAKTKAEPEGPAFKKTDEGRSGRFFIERLPGFGGDGGESLRLANRHVGQDLAVKLDPGFLQPADKLRIRHAMQTRRGVDPLNPQSAKVAFLVAAVAIGILQRLFDPLQCRTEAIARTPAIALGQIQNLFMPRDAARAALGACHYSPAFAAVVFLAADLFLREVFLRE